MPSGVYDISTSFCLRPCLGGLHALWSTWLKQKQLKWQKCKNSTQVLLYRYLCARTWCTETKSSVMHSLNSTYKTHNYKYTQHTRSLDAYTQGTVSSPAVERLPKEWGNHRRVDYDAPSSEWSVLGLPVHTWWLRCHYTEHMQGGECPCFLPPSTNLLMLINKKGECQHYEANLHMKRQLVMCQIHSQIRSLLFWMNPLTQKHI